MLYQPIVYGAVITPTIGKRDIQAEDVEWVDLNWYTTAPLPPLPPEEGITHSPLFKNLPKIYGLITPTIS